MKVVHCGQEDIKERETGLTGGRETAKRLRQSKEEIVAWQPVALSDDTLPTVLSTVNKCVCVKCYGECSV